MIDRKSSKKLTIDTIVARKASTREAVTQVES